VLTQAGMILQSGTGAVVHMSLKSRRPALQRGQSIAVPREHQEEALSAIASEFRRATRTTVVMACGTGKTLVGLWAAERQRARLVVVFVPSLALMSQTLAEWRKHARAPEKTDWICVCSDETVVIEDDADADGLVGDIPADRVTTDENVVRGFVADSRSNSRRSMAVIFCTYHSAPVLGSASVGLPAFDFAVFDEAHKTMGEVDSHFSFALDDANLKIAKRLFFTATPRRYLLDTVASDRMPETDPHELSMDDEEIYGRVAHRLSFHEAERRGLIVPYKVVVSVVLNVQLAAKEIAEGRVIVDGSTADAKLAGAQIALWRAIRRYRVRRAITFHSTVNKAEAFQRSSGSKDVGAMRSFERLHVSSRQSSKERAEIMRRFEESSNAVVSNARCLTEGVDVPSVDLVAFIDPKRSVIDIAQAAGRTMRLSRGKSCGYVFVPLFVDQAIGESVESAILRSDFREVVLVLNGMREADVSLDSAISMAAQSDEVSGSRPLESWIDVLSSDGELVSTDALKASISAKLVDELAPDFDKRVGQLKRFVRVEGHAEVPTRHPGGLGDWVGLMRSLRRDGLLGQSKFEVLDALGMRWERMAAATAMRLDELKEFKRQHGHIDVPTIYSTGLGAWLGQCRARKRVGDLGTDVEAALKELGVTWNMRDSLWEKYVAELKEFHKTHGHFNVKISEGKLGKWAFRQKSDFKNGVLNPERKRELDELGFSWGLRDRRKNATLEERLVELTAFRRENGNLKVPKGDEAGLYGWLALMKGKQRRGVLDAGLVQKLKDIGVVFEYQGGRWPAAATASLDGADSQGSRAAAFRRSTASGAN